MSEKKSEEKKQIMPSKTKELVKIYNKTYYEANKAKLLEDAVKKIKCDSCNVECSKSNMSKHIKTEKHKLNVKIKELQNA